MGNLLNPSYLPVPSNTHTLLLHPLTLSPAHQSQDPHPSLMQWMLSPFQWTLNFGAQLTTIPPPRQLKPAPLSNKKKSSARSHNSPCHCSAGGGLESDGLQPPRAVYQVRGHYELSHLPLHFYFFCLPVYFVLIFRSLPFCCEPFLSSAWLGSPRHRAPWIIISTIARGSER